MCSLFYMSVQHTWRVYCRDDLAGPTRVSGASGTTAPGIPISVPVSPRLLGKWSIEVSLPRIQHMRLGRLDAPFDHLDWLFELKYNSFRALAHIEDGDVHPVSRRGNAYKVFP